MPEAPKQPIEALLEAHAVKRRAEAGHFELHEATRRLLRDEARRVHGPPATVEPAVPARSAWFLLWTRLAGAFGFIALLGVAVLVIHQVAPAPELALARLDTLSSKDGPRPAPPANVPLAVATPATSLDIAPAEAATRFPHVAEAPPIRALAATASKPAANAGPSPLADSAPQSVAPVASPVSAQTHIAARMVALGGSVSGTGTQAQAAVPREAKSAVATKGSLSGTVFQRVEVPDGLRRNLQSPPVPGVLKSFKASLLGNRLRLEEADGSVYLGDINPADLAFSVEGTNRTNRLPVRFSGQATMSSRRSDFAIGSKTEAALPLPMVLEGTVVLGDRQQWRLRAEARP